MATDFQGGIGPDNPLGVFERPESRVTRINDYFRRVNNLSDAATERDAYLSITAELWADEDFRAVLVSALVRAQHAESDLEVISRVFGGSRR